MPTHIDLQLDVNRQSLIPTTHYCYELKCNMCVHYKDHFQITY